MPHRYPTKKGWKIPKQKYKINNWSAYNEALRQRGNIEVWISDEAIEQWYVKERIYDGTGTPQKFTNFAIIICHEIRQVYKLPLRQCQSFINSIFAIKQLSIICPDYSCLSKRLSALNISSPRYKNTDKLDQSIVAIAIDSTGLKRFGRDEWHQEKYKLSAKRSWRKLNIAVDDQHIIHAGLLTDRFVSDDSPVADLAEQINSEVSQITADGAYDKNPVYETLANYFNKAEIIIPPDSDAIYHVKNHSQRNRNLQKIKTFGRMNWQRVRNYGKRNYAELAIQRYKKILGNQLKARDLSRQRNEAMLGCSILNKMTNLGMPLSYRSA